jgi:hypothetical protein
MKPIGGFFELELPHRESRMHPQAYALSTGRACMMVMLRQLSPKLVYVPFYTCDAAIEPFNQLGIATQKYELNETLFPRNLPKLAEGEYLLWTNYFGVCGEQTQRIKQHYGKQVLLDDTHSFFRNGHAGFWSFTSARKYFGVPDGAFLYSPLPLLIQAERFKQVSLTHGLLRRLGHYQLAYEEYKKYEQALDCNIARISEVSEGMLRGIDLASVAQSRINNFNFIHSKLKNHNQLSFLPLNEVPFCYPYLPSNPVKHNSMHEKNYFIPTLWPELLLNNAPGFEFEKRISADLLPLPIDHRYSTAELAPMVDYLLSKI